MSAPESVLNAALQATLRADIQGMHAYAVQPSAGLIKLDAMENPFALPSCRPSWAGASARWRSIATPARASTT